MHHFRSPATSVGCCHGHGNQNYITTAPPRNGRDGLAKPNRWRFFGGRLLLLGHCLDEDYDDMALEPPKNSLNNLDESCIGYIVRWFQTFFGIFTLIPGKMIRNLTCAYV